MSNDGFTGNAAPLSQAAFEGVVARLGVTREALWALLTVETRGFGFLADRRPKILFERHVFHKRTKGRFDAQAPDLSSASRGGYLGGAKEYGRLQRAIVLDRAAALESTSWGLAQVMGFNAASLHYMGAEDMVATFLDGEDAHLDAAARFIEENAALATAFAKADWRKVAFYYNGSAYAEQGYHVKLEQFHDLYVERGTPDVEVRAAQARLVYLNYDPHGVDGVVGNGTRSAALAFQKTQNGALAPTGELDAATMEALKAAAKV